MIGTKAEQITQNFYNWERAGRGWYVFETPVDLEPIFTPFFPIADTWSGIDESFRPSLFSKAISFLTQESKPKEAVTEDSTPDVPQAFPFTSEESLESFSISFPKGAKPSKGAAIERFLTMLSSTNSTVCFEIVAWNDLIRLQFVCRASDRAHIESQVRAYFPSVILQIGTAYIDNIVDLEKPVAILDMGLEEEFMRPIAMSEKFDSDPLTGFYGILDTLQDDEQAVIQILFKGTSNPWAQSIIASVTDHTGESAFMNAPEMPKLALEKVSAPFFAVSMRVIAQDKTFGKASALVQRITTALTKSSQSDTNKLIALTSQYYAEKHLGGIFLRTTHRAGMLLNAKELATFVHYPFPISAKKLETDIRKTKRAPAIAWGHDFCLGTNQHQDFEGIVTLSTEQRLKHMHVIGATGTGKSTLLQSCIVQDIHLGNGVAVLDPHGDLIESILPYIPEERIQDVIIIDPADSEFPVGFNILTAHSDIEKEILASDLVSVFRRLSTSFGDQMHSVLANAI
ncbi:MAG: type IV secretion system DNA-binding domain-containing protein, partial [Bacteroidetes bacterium]|nr:type IV secretion system DNA-binding domain-containing protein [Bacteroidota bacterium]